MAEQGHPADRRGTERGRHQALLQQGQREAVRELPLQEQGGLQGGLEPLHLRLHGDRLLVPDV
uniref:Uncharacterized protein n=1 Tax=Anguilla anguilla TaxID=7936 RepID=A0A0E9TKF2_ANGAN